jgi:hypothetical protein
MLYLFFHDPVSFFSYIHIALKGVTVRSCGKTIIAPERGLAGQNELAMQTSVIVKYLQFLGHCKERA